MFKRSLWLIFIFLGILPHRLFASETEIPFSFITNLSYSLTDSVGAPLDHKIIKKLSKRNGVFIEVGAFDGVNQSNTKLLEEFYGWTGILIEPSDSIFPSLCANRPSSKCFNCCLGSFIENNTYAYGDFSVGGLMASLNGKRLNKPALQKVLIRSLQSILDEVGASHIDFFSLDTEGYELNILTGIDFDKVTFDYLLIEVYNQDYEAIVSLLASKGYDLIENFSNYNHDTCPMWDGSHNDYLFGKRV